MFVFRFINVVAAESYITSVRLIEVAHHEYHSMRNVFRTKKIKKELKKKMSHANSYAEWKIYAQDYDKLKGNSYNSDTSLYLQMIAWSLTSLRYSNMEGKARIDTV